MFIDSIALVLHKCLPQRIFGYVYALYANFVIGRNLKRRYGWYRSAVTRKAVDRDGRPIPWFTYAAIEYLQQQDWRSSSVFEYGCGQSTLWWSGRAQVVRGVEDNREWAAYVKSLAGPNTTIMHEEDVQSYAHAIDRCGTQFDVIVVDGSPDRAVCANAAVKHLKPDGVVILDNADQHPGACDVLRKAGLIQVDMSGFGPVACYTFTTSFFLRPAFRPKWVTSQFPMHSIASPEIAKFGCG